MGACGSKEPETEPQQMAASGEADNKKPPAEDAPAPAPAPGSPPVALTQVEPTLEEAPKSATLSAAATKRVEELFNLWDIDEAGKLELKAFTEASMQVGPHETKLLTRLGDMDIDHDGFITADEWAKWFAGTATVLNSEEFDLVMTEMSDAADNMVALIRCTRLAAEAPAETPVEERGSLGSEASVLVLLEGARLASVEMLFKSWDFDGKGEIDRVQVGAASVSFGPHKSRLFKQLESMDTDGDNVISLEEMKAFFQVVSPQLDDASFEAVICEMEELASEAATIAQCLAMAAETPTAPLEAESAEQKLPLPAARQELLGKLFGLFTESATDSINVEALEKCTIKEGARDTKLLTNLKEMDANSDGQLTLEEMTDYFAALGAKLSNEEFELIIGEMVDVCETNELAAKLAALAASA